MPNKFPDGTFVKHRQSGSLWVFCVVGELTSVSPGEPSLYACVAVRDVLLYHEDDLVELSDAELEDLYDKYEF